MNTRRKFQSDVLAAVFEQQRNDRFETVAALAGSGGVN
jgi:hypothetical protein